MDPDKWRRFAGQINDLRTFAQAGEGHCFWEAHLFKKVPFKMGEAQQSEAKDSLALSGAAGEDFPRQVEHVFRVRRIHGQTYGETKCDQMYLDTKASSDFAPGGRLFTERLGAKELCLTLAMHKLGKKIGRWGAKKTNEVTTEVKKGSK